MNYVTLRVLKTFYSNRHRSLVLPGDILNLRMSDAANHWIKQGLVERLTDFSDEVLDWEQVQALKKNQSKRA
jgi:hypothetical protein